MPAKRVRGRPNGRLMATVREEMRAVGVGEI